MAHPHPSQPVPGPALDPGPLPRGVWAFTLAGYVLCVLACWATRDFGYYFDDKYYVESVRVSFESGVPLPRRYHYPSFGYWVSLLAALPSWAAHGFDSSALAQELGGALSRNLAEPPRLILDARAAFAALSYLALFWVALLTWRLSRSRLAACAGVAVLALAFEFHYHARYWAPDAPMAQFVLLSVLCAHRHLLSGKRRDLLAAAIAAGLAAGTKFPGALALAGLGIAILLREWSAPDADSRLRPILRGIAKGAGALAVLLLVFVLTTPGLLFDAKVALQDISMELRHYQAEGPARGHGPYTVGAGWDHGRRMAVYVGAQALSYAPLIAGFLAPFALFGAAALARRDRRAAAAVLAVPLLYLAYFTFQRVLFVRNLEVLLPFMAVAFGLGVREWLALGIPRAIRLAGTASLLAALGWNAVFLAQADRSIARRGRVELSSAIEDFVASAGEPVFLAPRALQSLGARADALVAAGKAVTDPRAARVALVLPADLAALVARPGSSAADVRANWPRIYEPLKEGPWEVNYSYYPTWKGDARPLRIATEYYLALAGER